MSASIESFLGVPGTPVRVEAHGTSGLAPMWGELASLAPWLRVDDIRATAGSTPRVILRGARPHGAITFLGGIAGKQLSPFVETLRALATGEVYADTPATGALLAELSDPVSLSVVVSTTCAFCPSVAAAALRFACLSTNVGVTIVREDVPEAPRRVKAVPTVIANGHVIASGSIGEYALAEKVVAAARLPR